MAREHLTASSAIAGPPVWNSFDSPELLAGSLALTVAGQLAAAIAKRGKASLAVSGGTTPGLFFRQLSQAKIDWAKVTVTLVDERFVAISSERSNAGLVARTLLQNEAAKARFEGLHEQAGSVDQAAEAATRRLSGVLTLPFDVAVLGMGGDGHTASFFPDASTLPALLDPRGKASVAAVDAPSAGEPRLTWTLPALSDARLLILHIEGQQKKDVLLAALSTDVSVKLPVSALFDHAQTPVQIYWTPGGKA